MVINYISTFLNGANILLLLEKSNSILTADLKMD